MMMPSGSLQLSRLRSDLQYTIHQHNSLCWYSVHDPLNGQFYRLGAREYTLASMFQDDLSPLELVEQVSTTDNRHIQSSRPVSVAEVTQLASWLIRNNLCQSNQSGQVRSAYNTWILNPLSMRIPLIAGHHVERMAGWIAPILNSRIVLGMLVVYLAAIICAIRNWSILGEASGRLFVSDSHLWWLAAWLLLKVAHELGHAVAAVRVGSNVRAAGINIVYFAPIPYVDVSDLWNIPNKWQRIACSAAGILTELSLAAVATFVAVMTTSESMRYFCCALVMTGTVTTLAFNANPLMRFDGYYILSDLLNIPNLWTQSQQSFNSVIKRLLFPWQAQPKSRLSLAYAAYGGASLVYRWTMVLTLAATAILVWDSIGILLVIWAAYAIYINPMIKSYRQALQTGQKVAIAKTWKERTWTTSVVVSIVIALLLVPSPIQPSAPGVVTFHEPLQLNAESPGILRDVAVEVGRSVQSGDLIAQLVDADLELELRRKQLELQSVLESLRAQQARGNLADLQASQARLESLQTQLNQLELRWKRLKIQAPVDGTVVQLSVNNCLGRKITAGESICLLAPSSELEAKVSVSQRDLVAFHSALGGTVSIQNSGSARQQGMISKVDLKGNQYLADPLLAGCYNGPIPVEVSNDPHSQNNQWKLLAPRFDVHVRLSQSAKFVPGQLVWVKIPGDSVSIANMIGAWIGHSWENLRNQIEQ